MAKAKEQLDNLSAKVDDLISDVRAAKEQLEQDRDNLSPESQQALDDLTAKVDAFDAEVGDADGSDSPATGETSTGNMATYTPDSGTASGSAQVPGGFDDGSGSGAVQYDENGNPTNR